MYRFLSRGLPLWTPVRSVYHLVAFSALTSLTDRRERSPERTADPSRHLSLLADYGVRTLIGRFPS